MELEGTLARLIEMMFKSNFHSFLGTGLSQSHCIDAAEGAHFNAINPDRAFVFGATFDK